MISPSFEQMLNLQGRTLNDYNKIKDPVHKEAVFQCYIRLTAYLIAMSVGNVEFVEEEEVTLQ